MRVLWRIVGGRVLGVCLLGLVLGGCSSTRLSPIGLDPGEQVPEGEVVVFGRFTLLDGDGHEVEFGAPIDVSALVVGYRDAHALCLLDRDRSLGCRSCLAGDGTFFWHLKPGRYGICAYQHFLGASVRTRELRASFTVPAGDRPVYVGTYRLPVPGSATPSSVRNELSSCAARLAERFPDMRGRPRTSLLRVQSLRR